MYNTENVNKDNFNPQRFFSKGNININGENVEYYTVCEDNPIYEDGKAIASIFSYSYFRSNCENDVNRPVVFAFNGGPGSSSMYVHAGFFGTKRVSFGDQPDRPTSLPPYEVIDNPNCLLDEFDIVCIDPVGTGYGLLLDESKADQFFGIVQDAEALLTFIEGWLTRYNRWLSPKYVCGESYGCTRSAIAAGIAASGWGTKRGYAVKFDGLIMIGNTVTNGKYFNEGTRVEPSVIFFPTYAAINWYHNHPSEQTVEQFVKEAKEFADTAYLLALYQGEACVGKSREKIIEKIKYYTGVSEQYLQANALQIDEEGFRQEVIKNKGMVVSRYDGRLTRPALSPYKLESENAGGDATAQRWDGHFYGALKGVIFPSLGINLDRQYLTFRMFFGKDGYKWDYEEKGGTTSERLRDALMANFGMRVFFANGWYDDCTEIGTVYYLLDHSGLPKDRVFLKPYKSGHMIYLGEENASELANDIRLFIKGKNPTK